MKPLHLRLGCLLTCMILLTACSSPNKIRYYSLQTPADDGEQASPGHHNWHSLGIGPLTLPPTFNHPGIVSQTDSAQIRVSSAHVWAGDLDQILTHLLTQQLASLSGSPLVQAHPWDHRSRPDYQLKIHVEAFGGPLSGPVQLRLNWALYANGGRQELLRQRETYSADLNGSGYSAYVTGLNALVIQFGENLYQQIDASLHQP